MAKDVNLTSSEWCDIIFEGKNQKYGAYYLRKTSGRRHFRALIVVIAVATLLIFLPSLIKQVMPEKKAEAIKEVVVMKEVELSKPKPEQQNVEVATAPPPPALKAAIKFTAPVIDRNASEEETMRTQDEVNRSKATIFGKDIAGSDDPTAVDARTVDRKSATEGGTNQKPKTQEILDFAEVMPSYPGGDAALMAFLYSQVRYPQIATDNHIEGTVIVNFVVMGDGSVARITVARSAHSSLDNEAVRVVKLLGKFIPGQQNGQPVNVTFSVPITFQLQEQ